MVTKVLPTHATRRGVVESCEASLRRLGTDHVDLYLLHWRGSVPLGETVAGFHDLVDRGRTIIVIEHNLDVVARADHVIDIGPGAGHDGGRVVFEGPPRALMEDPASLTGRHLARRVAAA